MFCLRDFPPFEKLACFYAKVSGNFERFQCFERNFLKNGNLFNKLEYRILVENTKVENVSFPYKTALSKANVRTIEWGVQNGPITSNGVLPVTTLFF